MKIVIVGTAYPFRGGLAAFNERLAREFISMGHDVHIATFTVQYPKILFPGKSQMSDDQAPGLKISRWIHAFNPLNWPFAAKKIKSLEPDIIICKYWLPLMAPCFGTILRWSKTKKGQVVSILDNIIPHEHRPGDNVFTQYFVNTVDRFIYMSHQVGDDLKIFNRSKPAIFIPHPIYDNYGHAVSKNEAIEYLHLDPSSKYVLFFGFIREYKGLDVLYDAIALLQNDLPEVKFIIAGEYYTDSRPYDEQIKRLKIENRLILKTRFISNEAVKHYFCASDLVVQPYKTATQSGIAQIAIHFSKPAIVTKVGGLHEIVHDGLTGFVVEPIAVEISAAIKKFFKQADQAAMITAVENEKKNYEWRNMANAILGV